MLNFRTKLITIAGLFQEETFMLDDVVVFLNGNYVKWKDATVHVMCHSIGRGSAIFEVISFHDTPKGCFIYRLNDHIERLFRTAELLHMELPFSRKLLQEAVRDTVRKNGINQGFIKIIGFFPQISFEAVPPRKMLDLAIFAINPKRDLPDIDFDFETGASVCISKWKKLDPATVPIEAKVAANYLNGMMAREDAKKRGFDFAIMLDVDGYIAEGATESVFLVKENRLMTPELGTILNGITRRSILEAAQKAGFDTVEGKLPPEMLFQADEIFLSGTPNKLLPVRQIEDRKIGEKQGPVTEKLSKLMNDIVAGRDDRFKEWLFSVG